MGVKLRIARGAESFTLGFHDGRQTPTIETEPGQFNTLSHQYRVYHDFGVALADYRAALKATGAAEG